MYSKDIKTVINYTENLNDQRKKNMFVPFVLFVS